MPIPTNKDIAEVTYNGVAIPLAESGGSDSVFDVEYGVTTFAEIKDASDAGQICHMKIESRVYYLVAINSSRAFFLWTSHTSNRKYVTCASDNVWSDETQSMVQLADILDPDNYFSTDTVTGALQELGAAKLNPTTKTSAMTQAVGKDSNGALWTAPGGGSDSVFVVEYDETSFEDIYDAFQAGKICYFDYLGERFYAFKNTPTNIVFIYIYRGGIKKYAVCSSSTGWSEIKNDLQLLTENDMVTEITASSTDTEVPSAKAVYDLVQSSGGGGVSEVFRVTYGSTPFADIYAALQNGKICVTEYIGNIYYCCHYESQLIVFKFSGDAGDQQLIMCNPSNQWQLSNITLGIDSITGLRTEFGYIADAFGGVNDAISDKISCTDAQVASYGYLKLSDLPVWDGSVV